jgi:hypothetical protein
MGMLNPMAGGHPDHRHIFYEVIFSNISPFYTAAEEVNSDIACESGQAEQVHIRVIQKPRPQIIRRKT